MKDGDYVKCIQCKIEFFVPDWWEDYYIIVPNLCAHCEFKDKNTADYNAIFEPTYSRKYADL